MTRLKRITAAVALPVGGLLFLAGCSTMAPRYSRPEPPVPAAFPTGPSYKAEAAAGPSLADIAWQDFFQDEKLRKLISLALANNRDLRVATLNIERSQALYQIQRSGLYPQVNGTAAANIQRVPRDFSSSGNSVMGHQYQVAVGAASYELDLFGRVRSLKDQALQQFLATEQAQRTVQISLVSQVAASYLNLAADRERLELAKQTLASQQASYQLTKSRMEAGVSSALDLYQAQTTVDSARVDITRFTTQVAQDENALELVLGAQPDPALLPTSLTTTLTSVKQISPGLPSDVLLRRPDILQAENLLMGANANIGAARAAFFPRITLTGSLGFGSGDLANLFTGPAYAWSFLPQISVPIFNAGLNKANLKVAQVDRDIAVAQYEKTIQGAFREVADALAQRGTIEEQVAAQESLTDATSQAFQLSQVRYEKGVNSYLTVLDSQRSLYGAQQGLIGTRLARLANIVTLYKVLGGGSVEPKEKVAKAAEQPR